MENFRPALSADRYSSRTFPRNPPYVAWIPVVACSGKFPSGAGMTAPTRAGPDHFRSTYAVIWALCHNPPRGFSFLFCFMGFGRSKKSAGVYQNRRAAPWIPAAACPRRLLSGAGMTDMRSRTSRPAIPAKAYPRMLPSRGGFIPGSPPGGSQRRGIC